MSKRVIVAFPKFQNGDSIEQMRRKFDPLAGYVKAHITLVSPFESDISCSQLQSHIESAIQRVRPFPIRLQHITGHEGEYLFLNVKQGNDELIELRDNLYKGVLAPYLQRQYTFVPHLTVGRLPDSITFQSALECSMELEHTFEATISQIAVYSIKENGERPIKFTVSFG